MSKKIKGIIGLPVMLSLFWYCDTKEAEIDFDKNEITTFIDEQEYSQTFHLVGKYELFALLKYIISPFILFLFMELDISLRNEIGLVVAAIITMVWHRWRYNNKIIFKVGKVEATGYSIVLISIALLIGISTFVGLITNTIYYIGGAVHWSLISIAMYEIAFGFLSQDWKQHRKVYVNKLPQYIPRYFKLPEDEKSLKFSRIARQKIESKIYIIAMVVIFIASIGLVYEGATAYKEYKTQQLEMVKYKNEQQLEQKKMQAEQNGSVQTVIRYEKIQLEPSIEELHKKLHIPANYKEIKEVVYPWEHGYRGAYTTVIKPPNETKNIQ